MDSSEMRPLPGAHTLWPGSGKVIRVPKRVPLDYVARGAKALARLFMHFKSIYAFFSVLLLAAAPCTAQEKWPPPALNRIEVNVVGLVAHPGIYYLPVGAGVAAALQAAGGLNIYGERVSVSHTSAQGGFGAPFAHFTRKQLKSDGFKDSPLIDKDLVFVGGNGVTMIL